MAKPLQILALALLLFLLGAALPVAARPAQARCAGTALGIGAISTRPLAAAGEAADLSSTWPAPERLTARAAAEAPTSIGERRARAVAMTVFSLGAAIGAGLLVGYLIKRLL